jgi:uncharacterized membrane protein YkvA (DUF1232 family)
MPGLLQQLRDHSRTLKREIHAMAIAFGDKRTPWFARAWLLLVLAYAFSPIDLIPDFIPILGSLDDLILLPIGIAVAIRLVPAEVLADARTSAINAEGKAIGWVGALLIGIFWLVLTGLGIRWALPVLGYS